MKQLFQFLCVAVCTGLYLGACTDDTATDPVDDNDTAKVTVTDTQTSECYGFVTARRTADTPQESFQWSYDPDTQSLELLHTSLMLNCCGVRTVDASYDDGVVTIYENDQPEPDGGRCRCTCPFDFRVTLAGVPKQVLGVRIELTVDDDTTDHWSGAIDLADQQGSTPIGGQSPRIIDARASECYGFESAKSTVDEESETLIWTYDSAGGVLDMHHSALILNCCGVHTISATYADGVLTIHENDQPEPENGRCWCLCPFDFAVTIEGIPEQVLGVRIELTVDDDTTDHWAGAIDLSTGSGTVSIGELST